LHTGIQIAIPWSEKLDSFQIHYWYIDERLKVDLGYSFLQIPTDRSFRNDGTVNRIILDIFPHGGKERIGKLLANISVQSLYAKDVGDRRDDQRLQADPPAQQKTAAAVFSTVIPGFRFRRLSKAVNWNRLRGINVDRVVENNDVKTVLSCIDDIALGDAAEEGKKCC
jgi:hypothetical protein